MNEPQFFQTRMGQQYYEVTLPELVRQLARLNDMFAVGVELLEKQVEAKTNCCKCPDSGKSAS